MEHAISIDRSAIWATRNGRLEALKVRNVPTPDNQQLFGDDDLNKIVDPELYKATKNEDADKFIDALEATVESRGLPLSVILDQVTPSGNSLLHVAASMGKEDVLELILIHFPYLVTRKNSSEDTPLHVAIQHRIVNAAEKLIRQGTDLEIIYWKNKDGKHPLYLAAETGDMKILHPLLEASARDEAYAVKIQGMSPVVAALQSGDSGILEEIIDRLPKLLYVRGEDGGTPLHSAASVGNVQTVRLLLSKCSYLALQTDKNGSFPIQIACERGDVDIIRELAKMWPELAEMKNSKGQNILHVAAMGGKNKAVQYILKECGEPVIKKLMNSKDVKGNTPLHLASMHSNCYVLFSLTEDKRIEPELQNNDKLTALDVAMESGHLSTKYPAFLGRAILIFAGIPRSEGRNVRSPKDHAKWIMDQVNIRLLVATLVATVTFAAGFTLPGGYNASSDPHPGAATMLHNGVFQVFVISNTLAMYASIHAVIVLLWGHVTYFYIAELAYLIAGPVLLTALTCTSVAFAAAAIVAVSRLPWLMFLVLSIAVVYLATLIVVLAALVFPFSTKIAMRIVSLYYLVVALPVYAAAALRRLKYKK